MRGLKITPISVLNYNTTTQGASNGNLPPLFLTLAYNPYQRRIMIWFFVIW
jgi:hypothetical protein